MRILFNLFLYGLLGVWSALTVPVGLAVFALHKATGDGRFRKWARTLNWIYGKVSVWLVRPFFNIELINMDEAKKAAPCIIVSNHESILDLYMLGAQDCSQVCPVTKSWPFRKLFPFAPAMLTAGYINAESMAIDEIAETCRERVKEGCVLVFYPEGRRSLKLGRFHSGAFRFALSENLPIVPMLIRGSGKAIPPGSLLATPGEITVEMLPAITPEQYGQFRSAPLPHRALMKYVREKFKKGDGNENQADHSVGSGCGFVLRRMWNQEFHSETTDG